MIQRIGKNLAAGIQKDAKGRFEMLMNDSELSQSELARRIEVSPNTVSNWATGKTKVPGAVLAYLTLLVRVKGALD